MRFWMALCAIVAGLGMARGDPNPPTLVSTPMRDGVRLSANLFLPSKAGRVPTILIRTPYGKRKSLPSLYRRLVEAGYAVMVQDVRGRYDSGGVFDPLHQEIADGDDTLNWVAAQSWSNGRVGMTGGSYLGIVQWKAALSGNPHLKAIFPVVAGCDDYLDRFYSTGGAMKLGHRLLWMAANLRMPFFRPPPFGSYVRTLPVGEADVKATGQRIPMFQHAVDHPTYDEYWKSISTKEKLRKVKVPAYIVGGWYDNFVQGDLAAFSELMGRGNVVRAMIGPWPHDMSAPFAGDPFAGKQRAPIQPELLEWFDQWLKDGSQNVHKKPLRIFVMGVNRWREEERWPLARAVGTPLFLSSRRGANTAAGDGMLTAAPAGKARKDRFTFDPANPVPTMGGAVCCDPAVFAWGPMDQREVERRRDVLVYTSKPMERDLEVTGPIVAVLYVATSARDTDFTVKLVDVYPDGRAMNLTDGILRLRYREGLQRAVLAEPGKVYRIRVDAGVTSNVFRAGHRVRVEISSSNFPRFDRNPNTGGPVGRDARLQRAEQIILSGTQYPSAILLPVIRD